MPSERVQGMGTSRLWGIMLSSNLRGCPWHWLDHGLAALAVKNTDRHVSNSQECCDWAGSCKYRICGDVDNDFLWDHCNSYGSEVVTVLHCQSQTASWSDGSLCNGWTHHGLCLFLTYWHFQAQLLQSVDNTSVVALTLSQLCARWPHDDTMWH